MPTLARAVVLLSVVFAACSPAVTPADVSSSDAVSDAPSFDAMPDAGPPQGCNPLGAAGECLLPFPSNVFLDPCAVPGDGGCAPRVRIPTAVLPHTVPGNPVSVEGVQDADGFPLGAQILARFDQAVDPSNLPTYDPAGPAANYEASRRADSPTLLIDTQRQVRVPHVAEVDPRAVLPNKRALVLRPMEPLRPGVRYVVAIRNLRTSGGGAIQPTTGFRMLRDGTAPADGPLRALAQRYESDVFAPLTALGVTRGELQLAWDFTVRSGDNARRDAMSVRAGTYAALAATAPTFRVTNVRNDVSTAVGRRITGVLRAPRFTDTDAAGARLVRDPSGAPRLNGTAEVPVSIVVPRSVMAGGDPARLLQFGHGFFGSCEEIDGDFVTEFANRYRFVVACVDWWGMSRDDLGPVLDTIATDPAAALGFIDRVPQAFANQLSLAAARAVLAADPALQDGSGRTYLDPARVYFLGISQGHILGGTYVALSREIERATLEVGGVDFSLMMFRARPFAAFLALVALGLPESLDQQKFAALSQFSFDRIDPLTFAPLVLRDPPEGAPAGRRVLLQMGIGDTAVPNIATETHARALGVRLLSTSPRVVPGLEPVDPPWAGSALQVFDLHVSPLPGALASPPTSDTIVHEGVRRLTASQRQLDAFFRPDGTIQSFCDGPCDPE